MGFSTVFSTAIFIKSIIGKQVSSVYFGHISFVPEGIMCIRLAFHGFWFDPNLDVVYDIIFF